ncbi:MAG: helix-turn-helix transcriptional regulator [Pseudomonadota bacterium]
MNNNNALKIFAALSQETRLQALRVLVKHGKQGIAAGVLSDKLGIPHNTLSFHLSHLNNAGLVESRKQGRSIIYSVNIDKLQGLVRFLLKDCCAIDKSTCNDVEKLIKACAC